MKANHGVIRATKSIKANITFIPPSSKPYTLIPTHKLASFFFISANKLMSNKIPAIGSVAHSTPLPHTY